MGRLSAGKIRRCSGAPFVVAFLVLRCTEGAIAALNDRDGASREPGAARLEQGAPPQGSGVPAEPRAYGPPVPGQNQTASGYPLGVTFPVQPGGLPVPAGPLGEGATPMAGGALRVSGPAISLTGGSTPFSGVFPTSVGAVKGLASAPELSQSGFGGQNFTGFPHSTSQVPSSRMPLAQISQVGIQPQGTVGSLQSRIALAASLPLPVQEAGGVTTAAPVTDTRTPVGFYSSANGTYVVPRFPSALHATAEPSEEMIDKCILRIPAAKMTNGFSDTLKHGGVQIYGNAQHQLLRVLATSVPRFTSKITFPFVLIQRLGGVRIRYEVKVDVPTGCVLLPGDPHLMALVRRVGPYTTDAKVRLMPDVLATYMPSVATVPADILTFAARLTRNSNFKAVGHCVYVAHFTAQPENILLAASYTSVQVTATSATGTEALGMEIPISCLPQSPHRTAMWTAPVGTGTAVIVAFSPPPPADPAWFLIPTTGDQATFNRTSAPAP